MSTSQNIQVAHDYANLDGVRLHYAHTGGGPLVIFLHGFPSAGTCGATSSQTSGEITLL